MGHYTVDVDTEELERARARARLRMLVGALDQLSHEMAAGPGQVEGSWSGHAADQVTGEMKSLAGRTGEFARLLAEAEAAVVGFETAAQRALDEVAALNRRVEATQQGHEDNLRVITRTQDFASSDGGARGEVVSQARAKAQREREAAGEDLARDLHGADLAYQDIVERLRVAAATFGAGMAAATVAPVPAAVVGGYRGGTPSPAVLGGLRDAAIGALAGDLPLVAARHAAGWDLFASQQDAEAEATRLAGSLDRSLAAGEAPPPDDLALLARYQHNPWFATALVTRIGPAGLVDLAGRAQGAVDAFPDTHPLHTPEEAHRLATDERALVTAVAGAFTTATHAGLPAGYARAMLDRAGTGLDAGHNLSVLLHQAGALDPTVALTLAEGVYAAQRAGAGTGAWRALSDPAALGAHPHDLFGHPEWADPLTGVAQMLARDPATAQSFLLGPDATVTGEATPPTTPPTTRLHVLTAERDWTLSDDGVAYGNLIEAATTRLRDHDGIGSPGYRSAQIAAGYLHDLPGTIPAALQPGTGHVLAAYITDVQRSQTSGDQAGDVYEGIDAHLPGRQSYGARLDWLDTNRLLHAVMGDDEAFRSVTAAQHALAQQQLSESAKAVQRTDPGVERTAALKTWNGVIHDNALLWGATMDAANLAHIEEGQAADARTEALQHLVAAATGTVPVPGGKAVEFLFSQAHEHVFSQPLTHHEADQRLDANYTVRLTGRALRDLAVTSAAAHHLLDDGASLAGYRPTELPGGNTYFLRPDGTITPWAQMTIHQQDAYDSWLRSDFLPEQSQISDGIDDGIPKY